MTAKAVAELDHAIGTESGPWHDHNREFAWKIVANFSDSEWLELDSLISKKPSYWQERCADAISATSSELAHKLLKNMILKATYEAATIAANALADDEGIQLSEEYRPRLLDILARLSPRSPIVGDIEHLLKNIK